MYYEPKTQRTFVSHSEIRAAFTNVLFSSVIDDETLAYSGIFPVVYERPQVAVDQTAEPTIIEEVEGTWTQLWHVRPASQDELEARAVVGTPTVPQKVSRRQARQALLLAGLLDQVSAKIALIEDITKRRMVQIEWEDSPVFERKQPLLIEIGAAIGLDEAGLDRLFIEAAAL